MPEARPEKCEFLPLVRTARDIPAVPGAYALAIALADPLEIAIGGSKRWVLPAGHYLYCGSANGPGGLMARIGRHLRRGKPVHWHEDHLTERATVLGAWIFPGGAECTLATRLARVAVPVYGFGSTDCRRCAAHLFIWTNREQPRPWPSGWPRPSADEAFRRSGSRRRTR